MWEVSWMTASAQKTRRISNGTPNDQLNQRGVVEIKIIHGTLLSGHYGVGIMWIGVI